MTCRRLLICTECLQGYFGIGCSGKCSGHCINNEPCDHVSGECTSGCQDGFVGTFCNKCKTFLQSF